jgi:predicted AAA+ superfamily ATPase
LNLLETGCLVTRIRPFATNPNVALVKTPKLLWTDCGLAAFLAGIKSPMEATARPDAGFWLEQTIFQTLQTWRALDPLQRRLHFWRDRPGHEVDFIHEQNGQLVALEIKSGSTVTGADAGGIRAFRDSLTKSQNLVRGVVLHAGQARPLDKGILALPWGWMAPGAQKTLKQK